MIDYPALSAAIALLVALAADRWWGEPPLPIHPVVWMGRALGWTGEWVQRHTRQGEGGRDTLAFTLAAHVWCLLAGVVVGLTCVLAELLHFLPWWCSALLIGVLLKPMLAWALLWHEVKAVEDALGVSLAAGREQLARLVSRDVGQLSEAQVRESVIESLAENLNDSVVAPIVWFLLWGLPGAALYRFSNTADAMWGYRGIYKGQNWEWAGKWAACADDVMSWLPARITAALLLAARGRQGLALWPRLKTQARQTPSPNSGWPMAAMALNLDVALCKPGVYVINPQGREVTSDDVACAIGHASKALTLLIVLVQGDLVLLAAGVLA